jgi:Protein of unknown function (DUF3617)
MTDLARLLAALTLLVWGAASAQPTTGTAPSGLKPGSWEISTVAEFSDGASTHKTITSRLCYSPEDVASPTHVLPPQRGLGVQCLASDVKIGGQTGIAWKLTCKGKDGPMNGSGAMKPGPTAYSAEVRLERKTGGKALKIEEKTSGRWLGPCP